LINLSLKEKRMSDSENEEIPATEALEVEEEAPPAPEPPPKKACLTPEERKAKKKNANSKYYENVRKKLQEAEEKEAEEKEAEEKAAKEEKKEAKPKAKRKPKKRTPSPEVVVRRRAPPKRARVRSPSPVSPRTVLRDAYLIMKSQERERKEEKYRSWYE
jgi:FKBP-type peptidyl-prolyl cis-trans isomerase